MRKNKFGIYMPTGNLHDAKAAAVKAEHDGFFSVSTNDHFYSPLGGPETPQLECYTTLATVAAVTSKIKLVPAITSIAFRPPALLAKIISTLDVASNGRFICGLGAGWLDKEYLAHGYVFPSLAERLEQLYETIKVLKAMFTQEVPSFKGKHFTVENAYNNPRPVQAKMPFMIGGSGTGLLRIAAREADIISLIPPTHHGKDLINDPAGTVKFTLDTLKQRIGVLHGFMREAGRDTQEMELSGICFVAMSHDKSDPNVHAMAARLGYDDYKMAQASPSALLGTPEEVRVELRKRIEETGVTYYILMMANSASHDIFAQEIMPEFTA